MSTVFTPLIWVMSRWIKLRTSSLYYPSTPPLLWQYATTVEIQTKKMRSRLGKKTIKFESFGHRYIEDNASGNISDLMYHPKQEPTIFVWDSLTTYVTFKQAPTFIFWNLIFIWSLIMNLSSIFNKTPTY